MAKSENRKKRQNQNNYDYRRVNGIPPARKPKKEDKIFDGRAKIINAISRHLILVTYKFFPGASIEFSGKKIAF